MKSIQQINKEADVTSPETTPAVIAYRVAQLELTQQKEFRALNEKLDSYVQGFVTEKEMQDAKAASDEVHKQMWLAINGIKLSVKWWVGTIILAVSGFATFIMAVKK